MFLLTYLLKQYTGVSWLRHQKCHQAWLLGCSTSRNDFGQVVHIDTGLCHQLSRDCDHNDSGITVARLSGIRIYTLLLQLLDLSCRNLFRSSSTFQTSPTDCSDWRTPFCGKHKHGTLWLLVCGALEKQLLTYLLRAQLHNRRWSSQTLWTKEAAALPHAVLVQPVCTTLCYSIQTGHATLTTVLSGLRYTSVEVTVPSEELQDLNLHQTPAENSKVVCINYFSTKQ